MEDAITAKQPTLNRNSTAWSFAGKFMSAHMTSGSIGPRRPLLQ